MITVINDLSEKWPQTRILQVAVWLSSIGVGSALLTSAYPHFNNPYRLLEAIYRYRIVPRAAAELLAALLPFLHITLALCLITGYRRRAAFGAGVVLFALYAVAQLTVLSRHLTIDCGCFAPGATSRPVGVASVTLAVGSMLLCVLGWWFGAHDARTNTTIEAG